MPVVPGLLTDQLPSSDGGKLVSGDDNQTLTQVPLSALPRVSSGMSATPAATESNPTDDAVTAALATYRANPQLASYLGTDVALSTLLNREFSTSTAADTQRFNAQEAAVARDWAAAQSEIEYRRNAAEAALSRDWQQQMSSTQYQRAIQDMRAAGLNPILAYSQGGSSAGTGATAVSPHATSSAASAPAVASSIASPSSQQRENQEALRRAALSATATTAVGLAALLVKLLPLLAA